MPAEMAVTVRASWVRAAAGGCATTAPLRRKFRRLRDPVSVLVNQQVASCAMSEEWLTSIRGLASDHHSQGERIGELHHFARCPERGTHNRDPSPAAVTGWGQRDRLERDAGAADWAPARAGADVPDRRPPAAGAAISRSVQLTRRPYRQKDVRVAQSRMNVAINFYNVFNSNAGTAFNQAYRSHHQWRNVAITNRGVEPAVCTFQCDIRVLTSIAADRRARPTS